MLMRKINFGKNIQKMSFVRYISAENICCEMPTFRSAEDKELDALAASIGKYGMLHPLTVRKKGKGFEVVCGRRRLCAARLCGMKRIPCIVVEADDKTACAMSLAENIQRCDTCFLEIADGLYRLVHTYGCSVEEASIISGLSEKQVVRKLHVLRLPQHLLFAIRDTGLSERHALALLKISNEQLREAALCEMAYRGMSADTAEKYVAHILREDTAEEPPQRPTYVVKDVRMFLNSVSRGLDMMRGGGIAADCMREDSDNCIKLTIRIPDTAAT